MTTDNTTLTGDPAPITDAADEQPPAQLSASGITPEAWRLGSMLVAHVRQCRNAIDAWKNENPTTIDYRIEQARGALRTAEHLLHTLAVGDDPDLKSAMKSFEKAHPSPDTENTPDHPST